MNLRYLLIYDICCPKRLRKVSKLVERMGLRIQKSVFLVIAPEDEVLGLLDELLPGIDPSVDIVQVFRLANAQPDDGEYIGAVRPATPAFVICGPGPDAIRSDW